MSQERRKILYLRPEMSAAERYVDERLNALPARVRGDMARTSLLAGFALSEIDNRLPGILAAALGDDTKAETLRALLASFLEIQPAAPAAAPAAPSPIHSSDPNPKPAPKQSESVIAKFAKGLPD